LYEILKRKKVQLVYIPLVLYWILLFIATTIPAPALPDILDFSDKVKHFGAYLGFAVLLALTFHFQEKYKVLAKYFLIAAIIAIMLYGAADEIHQIFIPNRMCEFLDWVADVAGGSIGAFFAFLFIRKSQPE